MNTLRNLISGVLMLLAAVAVPLSALAATDTTSPTTSATLTGTLQNDGWYSTSVTVTLSATDGAGGSGVAKTEYSLDNVTWQMYAAPFVVDIDGKSTLFFRSTDTAGNVESPAKTQEIKINKTGLVGLWNMENNWLDSSVVGNNGIPYNGVKFSPNSQTGMSAGSFDGVDDYLRIPNSSTLNPTNQITVAAWYNPKSFVGTGNDAIVDKGYTSHAPPYYEYHLGVTGDQFPTGPAAFLFTVATGGGSHSVKSPPNSWVPGKWYYVVGTYDGATLKLYINGVLSKSTTATGTLADYGKDVYLGRFGNLSSYLPGLMDDVRIYNRALSDTEIQDYYSKYLVKSPTVNPVPTATAMANITLSGSKPPNTAIVVNGKTLVPVDGTATWQTGYVLSAGTNNLTITAQDSQYNNSLPVALTVVVDATPPVVTATTPTNNALMGAAPGAVIFTLADALSPLDFAATLNGATVSASGFKISGTWSSSGNGTSASITFTPSVALADGSYTVTIKPTDVLANSSTYNLTFTIDGTPPAAPAIDPVSVPVSTTGKTITGSKSSDSVSVVVNCAGAAIGAISYPTATTWSVYVSGLKEGSNTITAYAVDAAGNQSSAASATIAVDTIPPTLGATPAGAVYNSPQSVTLAASESAVIYYTIDGSAPTTGSTTYSQPIPIATNTSLKYFARDLAGNDSEIKTENFEIDTSPPVLANSTLSDGAYTNNQILNIAGTVTDNTAVQGVTVNDTATELNADGSFSYPLLLKNGLNVITIVATDSAGNKATDKRSVTLDQTAPVLTVTTADNSKTGNPLLQVSGTVDKASTVTVKINNNVQSAIMNDEAFTAAVTLAPGYNTIEITATDLAGNQSSVKRTVVFDDQVPSLAVTVPNQDVQTNQSSLTIKGTVVDALTAVSVTISVGNEIFTPEVIDGAFEQVVNFTEEKAYGIVVTATNEVGTSASVQRNVIYDITSPTLGIDPVTTLTSLSSQSVSGTREAGTTVTVTCPTATVGVVSYPTTATWLVAISGMKEGENVITAASTDAAGNASTATAKILLETKPFIPIMTPPQITITATPDVIWPPSHKMVPVTIAGGVEANGSIIKSVSVSVSDEYGKYEYENVTFGSIILLEGWRNGDDIDGRKYTITVVVTDMTGAKTAKTATVTVPHDIHSLKK